MNYLPRRGALQYPLPLIRANPIPVLIYKSTVLLI